MIRISLGLAGIFLMYQTCCASPALRGIYIDEKERVHIITQSGKEIATPPSQRGMLPSLSPDRKVAAWLLRDDFVGEEGVEAGASILAVYTNSRVRTVECSELIRRYWFWEDGRRIGVDCGGRHFSGRETLYDSSTLRVVDSFDQDAVPVENRPRWSLDSPSIENSH